MPRNRLSHLKNIEEFVSSPQKFFFTFYASLSLTEIFFTFYASLSLTEILVNRLVLVPGGVCPVSANATRENDGHDEKEEEQSGNGDRELGDHQDRRVRDWNSRLALNRPVNQHF